MLNITTVATDKLIILIGQFLVFKLFFRYGQKSSRNLGKLIEIFFFFCINNTVSLKPFFSPLGKEFEPAEYNRLRINKASVIGRHFFVSAAHLSAYLFRIKDGIMFEFGKRACKCLKILFYPLIILHIFWIPRALLLKKRSQSIKPARVQTDIP